METILKIHRLYHKDGLSQRQIAEKLHLSRLTVKKYLNTVDIPQYQRQHTVSPKLGPYKALLIERLEADRTKPPGQRLTAVRHFEYLKSLGFEGKYPCVSPKTIVKQIKPGKERAFNEGFLAMMNHFLIEPIVCTPASGWEKGQVERQVQTLRKRIFCPLLAFSSLAELNDYLRDWCARQIQTQPWVEDKQQTIAPPAF